MPVALALGCRVTRLSSGRQPNALRAARSAPRPTAARVCCTAVARPRIAVASAPPVHDLTSPEVRRALEVEYGFQQIGSPVPSGTTLQDIVNSLPAEVFEIDDVKAWSKVALSIASFAASLWLISVTPWFLLPVSWFISGTAFTGFFVVGHDCGHRAFSRNKLVEDVVGTLMFMPLIYPFEPWRIKHNKHHAITNMLDEDTAWHPVMRADYESWPAIAQNLMKVFLGPLRPWASVGHWYLWHFDLAKYTPQQQQRVKISLAAVAAFAAFVLVPLAVIGGPWALVKYWLMPWLGYHFWMSTFTMIHHTAPHIPFKKEADWDGAVAQMGGTTHCDFPAWIEVLCHDISVHVPHHVTTRIPSYNLRKAHEALLARWGPHMNLAKFNWKLMRAIMTQCHLYDETANYVAFDNFEAKKDPLLQAVRSI